MTKYRISTLSDMSIKLTFKGKSNFPKEYLLQRESCWASKLKMHGEKLWNGNVYTIDKITKSKRNNSCEIQMGVCEYKDIVFKITEGPDKIESRFGRKYLMKDAITTVLPYTTDSKFLFGIVSKNTIQQDGALDQIGGTLNKNEKIINDITDIASYTEMEIEEEIGMPSVAGSLVLDSLNYYYEDGRYRFLYLLKLPHDSTYYKSLLLNNELSGIKFMTKGELLQYSGPSTNRIPFCKKHIERISDNLKRTSVLLQNRI